MKKLSIIIFFISFGVFSQNDFYKNNLGLKAYLDSIVQFESIDSIEIENEFFSKETYDGGSMLKGYFHNGKLFKIKAFFGLSYGNSSCEYYLKNEELYLVIDRFNGFKYDSELGTFDYSKYDIAYEGKYLFEYGNLIDMISLGHWRFEDDSNDPEKVLIEEFKEYFEIIEKSKK